MSTCAELIPLRHRLEVTRAGIQEARAAYFDLARDIEEALAAAHCKTLLEFLTRLELFTEKEMRLCQLCSREPVTDEQRKLDSEISSWYENELPEWSKIPRIVPEGLSRIFRLPGSSPVKLVENWEQVEITFLSDERVQIIAGTSRETLNYAEFGFQDGRNGKPDLAWSTLRTVADRRGILHEYTGRERSWPRVEKRMQDIRRVLRKHFGLDSDPLPFVPGTGYRALFKIGVSPSVNS
jgi:hypothetical protein